MRALLGLARESGISLLDTAASYGDSEAILGRTMHPGDEFRIVTKTPVVAGPEVTDDDVRGFRRAVEQSLARLGRSRVYGLLVHQGRDIAKPGGDRLVDALGAIRDAGLADRIGVSVYTGDDIDAVLARFQPDIVQVPINIADQRLIQTGHLAHLKRIGIEVHGRSLFLQGVLLQNVETLPAHFATARAAFAAIGKAIAAQGLNPLQACLSFGFQRRELDALIVGATTKSELQDIVVAAQSIADRRFDGDGLGIDDPQIVDPTRWPQRSNA